MRIDKIVNRMKSLPNCDVFPPDGLPKINEGACTTG